MLVSFESKNKLRKAIATNKCRPCFSHHSLLLNSSVRPNNDKNFFTGRSSLNTSIKLKQASTELTNIAYETICGGKLVDLLSAQQAICNRFITNKNNFRFSSQIVFSHHQKFYT